MVTTQALWDRLSTLERRLGRNGAALFEKALNHTVIGLSNQVARPWPTKVGIDDHLFKHDSRLNTRRFVTIVVDHKNWRLVEVVESKEGAVLKAAIEHIPGARTCARWLSTCPTAIATASVP